MPPIPATVKRKPPRPLNGQRTTQPQRTTPNPATPIPSQEYRSAANPSDWVEKELLIPFVLRGNWVKHKVKAWCYGSLAVYRGIGYGKQADHYVLGSLTTMLAITYVTSKRDALKIGGHLWLNYSKAFRRKTEEEIKSELPSWVGPWLVTCRKEFRWVDPDTFREEYEQ